MANEEYLKSMEAKIDRLERDVTRSINQRNQLAYNSGNQLARADKALEKCRADAALVVHALNCAVQLIEALITYTPEGTVLHPGVASAKSSLDQAMRAIRGN